MVRTPRPTTISTAEYQRLAAGAGRVEPAGGPRTRPPTRPPAPRAPRKAKGNRKASSLEQMLEQLLVAHRLPLGVAEHAFAAPERRWRFDRAWPDLMVAVEIHGGTYARGAHSRGRRQRDDFAKANAATLRGWRVLYADTDMVTSGEIIAPLRQLLALSARKGPS